MLAREHADEPHELMEDPRAALTRGRRAERVRKDLEGPDEDDRYRSVDDRMRGDPAPAAALGISLDFHAWGV
jgi:hypothetical protein